MYNSNKIKKVDLSTLILNNFCRYIKNVELKRKVLQLSHLQKYFQYLLFEIVDFCTFRWNSIIIKYLSISLLQCIEYFTVLHVDTWVVGKLYTKLLHKPCVTTSILYWLIKKLISSLVTNDLNKISTRNDVAKSNIHFL